MADILIEQIARQIRRRWRQWLAWLVLLVGTALVTTGYDVAKQKTRGDFARYSLAASRVMWEGGNPYSRDEVGRNYKYLPLNVVLLRPFIHLPLALAQGLWVGVNVTLLVWCFRAHARAVRRPVAWWVWGVALAITGRFFVSNIRLGQWNTSVYCLSFAGLILSRRRPWRGGALAGLAAALKYMPALLLLFFLARREWRALTAMTLGTVFWALVLPTVALGPSRHVALLGEYRRAARDNYTDMFKDEEIVGNSLTRQLYAFLTPALTGPRNRMVYVNLADLSPETARRVSDGVGVILLLGTFLLSASLPPRRLTAGALRLIEPGVWLALLLLISPEVRDAHMLSLFTLAFGLSQLLAERRASPSIRKWAGAMLAVAFVAMLGASQIVKGSGHPFWVNVHGGFTLVSLSLFLGGIAALLGRQGRLEKRI